MNIEEMVGELFDVFDENGSPVDPQAVAWNGLIADSLKYRFRQAPGTRNPLGTIKFLFPNEYGICMHDTPSKQLFAHDSRAFSHGCVRMDHPVGFTESVLETEGWTRDDIVTQLDTTDTLTIPLAEPIPVIVVYLTAMVDEEGTVHFYRDIYGRDEG